MEARLLFRWVAKRNAHIDFRSNIAFRGQHPPSFRDVSKLMICHRTIHWYIICLVPSQYAAKHYCRSGIIRARIT